MNWLCARSKSLWIIAWGAWCDRCVSVFPHSFHGYEFNQNGYVCVIGWLWKYQTKLCNAYTDCGHYGYYWWLWYSWLRILLIILCMNYVQVMKSINWIMYFMKIMNYYGRIMGIIDHYWWITKCFHKKT